MTSSVPYSFVPGTKAKADEVNANFIAVLDRIEQVNADTKTQLNTSLTNYSDNLTGSITNLTNTKADRSEIDGCWTYAYIYIAQNFTIPAGYQQTFDLSGVLPNDGQVYEIILNAMIRTGTAAGNALDLVAGSDLAGGLFVCRAVTRINGVNQIASGSVVIPIPANRQVRFTVSAASSTSHPNGCSFKISAYRKAR